MMELIIILQVILYFAKLADCGDSSNTRPIFVRVSDHTYTGRPIFVKTYINRPNPVKDIQEKVKCYICEKVLIFYKQITPNILNNLFLDNNSSVTHQKVDMVCTTCMLRNFVLRKSFFSDVTDTIVWKVDINPDSQNYNISALYIPDTETLPEISHFFPNENYFFYINDKDSLRKMYV